MNIVESTSKRLNINDLATIRKCEEFLRQLRTKSALKLSDQVKTVICLDLAASFTGIPFESETALTLCNLRKSVYANNVNNIKKLLNVDKPLNIPELCVQFSCSHLKEVAEKLHKNYMESHTNVDKTHPQYIAASVYTICKLNRIKLAKSQLQSLSRLKSAQWLSLLNDFEKFASTLFSTSQENDKNKLEEVESIEDRADEEIEDEPEIEEYEVWSKRILGEAQKMLRNGVEFVNS